VINGIFEIVKRALESISEITGLSYNEVNVVVYYAIVPLIYVWLGDRILKRHTLKICFLTGWTLLLLFVPDFEAFADVVFYMSAGILEAFAFLGLGYVGASVLICVVVPLAVFVVLLHHAFPNLARRILGDKSAD
jgi:hypothetical protein